MKVFDLKCQCGYQFEAWFQSAEAFEAQQQSKMIECPMCNATQIKRLSFAPRLLPHVQDIKQTRAVQHMEKMYMHFKKMIANSEDVGEDFAQEARRIFYQESPVRNIHGQASLEETLELMEEGIQVMLLPRGLSEKDPIQ